MRSDDHFIVIGSRDPKSTARNALFGDVANGLIKNAGFTSSTEGEPVFRRLFVRTVDFIGRRAGIGKSLAKKLVISPEKVESMLRPDKNNIIIYVPGTKVFMAYPESMPDELRKRHPDCRQVFFLIDSLKRTAAVSRMSIDDLLRHLQKFDLVVTYDNQEAKKYGFSFVVEPIWHAKTEVKSDTEYDLYYCGRCKGRTQLMNSIMQQAKSKNVSCQYHVVAPGKKYERIAGVKYTKWSYYYDIVDELKKCNCLLDINADFNTGYTLRCKEAVIYNKKLITNSPQIKELKYYDPRWMRIYEKVEDIDFEWVSRKEEVDYHYAGEFTAESFLESVSALLSDRS